VSCEFFPQKTNSKKHNPTPPPKKKRERRRCRTRHTHKGKCHVKTKRQRKDHRGRYWNNMAANQGMEWNIKNFQQTPEEARRPG
jgi:hypothetical protein